MQNKILPLDALCTEVECLKRQEKKIVATSGCFDILHAGHVTYLEQAKNYGDILVLMLNSDASVKKLKGNERPVVSEKDRATVIAGLEAVDYVCIFEDETPCNCYKAFMPDVVVKGGDYKGKHIPEIDILSVYGGIVQYVDFVSGCSTTSIIEKIKQIVQGNEK